MSNKSPQHPLGSKYRIQVIIWILYQSNFGPRLPVCRRSELNCQAPEQPRFVTGSCLFCKILRVSSLKLHSSLYYDVWRETLSQWNGE